MSPSRQDSARNEQVGHKPRWVQICSTLASSVLGNLALILTTACMVRFLGGEAFGRVALLSVGASAISAVSSSGTALFIIRQLSLAQRSAAPSVLSMHIRTASLAGHAFAAALSLGAMLLIAAGLFNIKWLDGLMALLATQFLVGDAQAKARLVGRKQVLQLAAATVTGTLFSACSQLVGAWAGNSDGFLPGFALGSGLQWICSQLTSTHGQPMTANRGTNRPRVLAFLKARRFTSFVLPATVSAGIAPIAHWCASAIAASKQAQFQDVAILAVAMQFFNMVIFVPAVLNKIFLPHALQAHAELTDSREARIATVHLSLKLLALMSLLPLLAFQCVGWISSMYKFDDSAAIGTILAFAAAAAFASAGIPISNYFVSHRKMSFGLASNLVWATLYLGLSWYLPGGAQAVGFALLTAYIATLALAMTPLIIRR